MKTCATLLLLATGLLAGPAIAQTTYTWNGANPGDWAVAGNWSPNGIPGPADAALIASGQPVLNADATVANVTLSGGTLSGNGNLTVTGTFTWAGGVLNGRDYAETAALTIPAGATLHTQGDAEKVLNGRDIFNDGTILWEGPGNLMVAWGTLIENREGATFDIRNDAQIIRSNSGLALVNLGLIVKSAGAGTTIFNWPFGHASFGLFTNGGTVRVETGTLQMNLGGPSGGGGSGSGAIEVAAGARLLFSSGDYVFDADSGLNVEGTLQVVGGTPRFVGAVEVTGQTIISGGALQFNEGEMPAELADVAISGGELGGTGIKNVNGLVTWTGGALGTRFDSQGVLNLLGGVSAEGAGDKVFGGGTYNNAATFAWIGTGDLVVSTGGTFNNLEGALFDIKNDAVWTRTNGGLSFFNSGLVTKSGGTGTTTIQTPFGPFNNDGEIRVEVGTLHMNVNNTGSTSVDTGAWVVEEGAVLLFNSHQRTFTEAASLGGTGAVNFGNATIINRGTVRPGLSVGTLAVNGSYPLPQPEGVLEVELGGLVPGTEHDVLAVTGTANLGGTLRLALVDDYAPSVGDAFTVLTAGSIVGTFDAVEPPDGVTVDVAYTDSTVVVAVTGVTVANEPEAGVPAVLALHAPYPNPAAERATASFDLPEPARVRLAVYDVLGREVAVLVDAERSTGRYEVAFDGRGLAAGLYLVRMTAGSFTQTHPVTLLR